MTTSDLHTRTGAYALSALPERQEREFRAHLRHCDACTTEVREFRETAARLALAVAEIPPRSLHARVLAALPTVRQLPPWTTVDARALRLRQHRSRPGRQRMPYLAAAACVAASAILGGTALSSWHAADAQHARAVRAEQHTASLAAVLADPRAVIRTATLSGGGTATVVASPDRGETAFFCSGLPALSNGQVYQLWYAQDEVMRPAGLLTPQKAPGSVLLSGSLRGAQAIGITVEPHDGSPEPTSPPLALLRL
ncbi:anti-sigma factor domain-containing protein [Streptomyces sp. NPDC088354]|uniref:anti-sigma factor n=1 Tax=Streptomyces sp. NPDC088354 TaxID=3365856 RepID=UPI00381BE1BA